GQRHQGRLVAHDDAFPVCTSRKVAGSRSNGNVPDTGSKPSKAGPIEPAMRLAASASTGTPPASAMALMSFALGLVMPRFSRFLFSAAYQHDRGCEKRLERDLDMIARPTSRSARPPKSSRK